jgi:hypothetical protein
MLITNGEEGGRKGSEWLINENEEIGQDINDNHQFVIQLDRCDGTEYKCYNVGTSDFRTYIENMTHYSEPDRLKHTDIVTLCRSITGVNLSVGYHCEHSENEFLVLDEWQNTLNVCRRWLREDRLPRFTLE